MGERVRRHQVPVIGAGQGVASFVHIEDSASATVTALERAPGPYNIVDDNPSEQRVWLRAFARACEARSRFKLPSRKLWRLLAATASITPRACAAPPTRRQTRTQFPPTFARVAPITSSSGLTRMSEIELAKKAPDLPSFRLSHGDWPLIRHEQMTRPVYSAEPIRRG
jgi:hypothetical protein